VPAGGPRLRRAAPRHNRAEPASTHRLSWVVATRCREVVRSHLTAAYSHGRHSPGICPSRTTPRAWCHDLVIASSAGRPARNLADRRPTHDAGRRRRHQGTGRGLTAGRTPGQSSLQSRVRRFESCWGRDRRPNRSHSNSPSPVSSSRGPRGHRGPAHGRVAGLSVLLPRHSSRTPAVPGEAPRGFACSSVLIAAPPTGARLARADRGSGGWEAELAELARLPTRPLGGQPLRQCCEPTTGCRPS
jgi:hypothetical protein